MHAEVLCEQFIAGDEVTIPVLGSGAQARALPVIRIVAPDGNYDYQNKYFTDTTQYLVPCGLPEGEEAAIQQLVLKAYQEPGLPRLGPRRRDDRCHDPPALSAGDQHLAGHDQPFAGADGGQGGRHQLPGAVPAGAAIRQPRLRPYDQQRAPAARHQAHERAGHRPVRGAGALLLGVGLACGARSCRCLPFAGITVVGDVTHYNAITLRANVMPRLQGTFFTLDLRRRARSLRPCPGCARPWCSATFRTACKVQLQEHQAVAYWGAEGDSRLVNSFGEVFEANLGELEQDDLPRLNGPDGQSAQVLAMLPDAAAAV